MSFDIGKTIACNHLDYTGRYWGDPTEINGCPRCKGEGEYYDLSWGIVSGDAEHVEDLTLLEELVIKAVLTELGDNRFHPEYGTSIASSVGNAVSMESVARTLELEVGRALGQLYLRQQQQVQLGQEMSSDELIYMVERIETRIVDARTITVAVTVVAESGSETTITV